MKKTLAEILSEPANVDEIIRTAKAINRLIENTKKAGIVWPEVEEKSTVCNGTVFLDCARWETLENGCIACPLFVRNMKSDE